MRFTVLLGFIYNTNFQFYWWRNPDLEWPRMKENHHDQQQVIDKLYHFKVYQIHLVIGWNKLTTEVAIVYLTTI